MYALANCDVYTGKEVLHDKAIVIKGCKIESVVPIEKVPPGIEIRDLNGLSVSPGFIDIQVNGGGGILFNDEPSVESIKIIKEAHQKFGTTDIMPTFITGSIDKMGLAIKAVESSIASGMTGLLGLHIEGPIINSKKAGVHDKAYIVESNMFNYDLVKPIKNGKTIFTLAPEMVKIEIIEELARRDVIIAAGHTNSTYVQATKGFEKGISLVTHLFNAMSPFDSREPGMVGAALDNDEVWCSVIVDGYHVDFTSIRVAWKAKKLGKMILITDSMPPVGAASNNFKLGEYAIEVENGRCVTKDGTLAGSALDMATAVRNCIQKVGIAKDEALRMASTYTAQLLGVDDKNGYISEGYNANITIFNNQIYVDAVVVNGEYIKVGG